jgi:hypothetical protein
MTSSTAANAQLSISRIDDGLRVGLVRDITLHALDGYTVGISSRHECVSPYRFRALVTA